MHTYINFQLNTRQNKTHSKTSQGPNACACTSLKFHFTYTFGPLPGHFRSTWAPLDGHMRCPIIQFYIKIEFRKIHRWTYGLTDGWKKVTSKDPFRVNAQVLKSW